MKGGPRNLAWVLVLLVLTVIASCSRTSATKSYDSYSPGSVDPSFSTNGSWTGAYTPVTRTSQPQDLGNSADVTANPSPLHVKQSSSPGSFPLEAVPPPLDPLFPVPPDRDLFKLASSLRSKSQTPLPSTPVSDSTTYAAGRSDAFWIIDMDKPGKPHVYTQEFNLRLVSPRAYWYVDDRLNVSQADLKRAAAVFEEQIYPKITSVMGKEWSPGVDNDVHISIINGRLRGPAGYYSSGDEHPASVYPFSNEREAIYMNAGLLRVGSPNYLATLSHELQHVIHWAADPNDESWVNEGLAELATTIAGYDTPTMNAFLFNPTTSLVHWPLDPLDSMLNYGGASLFFEYLFSRFDGANNFKLLLLQPEDGMAGIDGYLAEIGSNKKFRDIFKDWIVANLLDEEGKSPYGYPRQDVAVAVSGKIEHFSKWESSIPQYGAEYVEIGLPKKAVTVRFQGVTETSLLPVELDSGGCWWGNRGDSISSSLTREVDLSEVASATLKYRIWFEIEKGWDYGYLQVSKDNGQTWDIIAAPGTTDYNPVGHSYGPGYTGDSEGWIEEEVDLSIYGRQNILMRFHYVTDDATNGTGLCIDDVAIPEIGFKDEGNGYVDWQPRGFVHVKGSVSQQYTVQVVEVGHPNRVTEIDLDSNNKGQATLDKWDGRDRIVVVVAAFAPGTQQHAGYTLAVEPDN